ncbi:MAG: peptidase [Phormidium sp. BM_Day4_Bin.17]|nr:peptidase [Phormidium sp. BM_Day4_Bin.17]UCJ13682.1 MAG: peptidase [Phormidium sp. PBR-2020]
MALAIALVGLIILLQPLNATGDLGPEGVRLEDLPYRSHPLPRSLGAIAPQGQHYGDRLEETGVGALVWSEFPVRVYLDGSPSESWRGAMTGVIEEWGEYLSLEMADESESADIVIWQRRPPPRRVGDDFRAAAARVSYDLYWREQQLGHRFEILLSPTQGTEAAQAALRHELGHALGIWGHSDRPTDVMYYSQVRHPPHLSPRDLRTLRYLYEQPTRLGWSLLED